ncbi:MAG: DUF2281 domain-containing protein [Anaerolineales bacterium]|nr:DUF2281 domain-containing protein [Anaerolineales bacterium]
MAELSLQEMLKMLPPSLQTEVRDFVALLLKHRVERRILPMKFQWEGALKDLRGQYTSVEVDDIIIKDMKVIDWGKAREED